MMISFLDTMNEKEKRERWKALSELYIRPFLKRLRRRIYNALGYVKDKLTSAISATTTSFIGGLPPDLKKALQEAEKKAIGATVAQSYDPLLENSIGRLVIVKVEDIDGEKKLYQGILSEYSDKYLYVLDVDYRLQMMAEVKGGRISSYRPIVKFFGIRLDLGNFLSLEAGIACLR